jgi:hypothetical protein
VYAIANAYREPRPKGLKRWEKHEAFATCARRDSRAHVAFVGRAERGKSHCWDEPPEELFRSVRDTRFRSRDRTPADVRRTSRGRNLAAPIRARNSIAPRIRQNNFDAQSVACERPRSDLAQARRSWHTRCFTPSVSRWRFTVTKGHFTSVQEGDCHAQLHLFTHAVCSWLHADRDRGRRADTCVNAWCMGRCRDVTARSS